MLTRAVPRGGLWHGFVTLNRGLSTLKQPLRPPLLLILDLDETLVRVACKDVHKNRNLERVDFNVLVEVASSPKQTLTFDCGVAVRPGLDTFFRWIKERRNAGAIEGPWIFTTATPVFVKAILQKIDPGGTIFGLRILARGSCTPTRMPGYLLKDLSRIRSSWKDSLDYQRKVLIDNSPISCIHDPGNSVLVRDWLGSNSHDTELARVQSLLDRALDQRSSQAGEDTSVNYAGCVASLMPGHAQFQKRLQEFGTKLNGDVPKEIDELRTMLRMLTAECNDIKRELLGAAP